HVITPELCTTELRYGTGYADSHKVIAKIDPDGIRTSYTYDGLLDWIASITLPGGGQYSYGYADWYSGSATTPNGQVTQVTLDTVRRITGVTSPLTHPWTTTYFNNAVKVVAEPNG